MTKTENGGRFLCAEGAPEISLGFCGKRQQSGAGNFISKPQGSVADSKQNQNGGRLQKSGQKANGQRMASPAVFQVSLG
jgi:hypothetical protein